MLATLLYFSELFGQSTSKILILDKKTFQPLSYSTVRIKNKNVGVYADENGLVDLALNLNDTLLVSHIGYHNTSISTLSLKKNDTIFLIGEILPLPEISIRNLKPLDEPITIGSINEKPEIRSGSMIAAEFATRFLLTKKSRYNRLLKIVIPLSKGNADNKIRLHIYDVNEDLTPGDELLTRDIIIDYSKNSRKPLEVDIRDMNIIDTSTYIFVGLEWIGNSNERKVQGPYVRFTQKISKQLTYTRTINDSTHSWVKFQPKMGNSSGNPPNLIIGLTVQPLKN